MQYLVEASKNPIIINEGLFSKFKKSAILQKFSKREVKDFVKRLVKGNININDPFNKTDKEIIKFINDNICKISQLKKVVENTKPKDSKFKNNKLIQQQQETMIMNWIIQQQIQQQFEQQNLINLQNMINQQQIDLINQIQVQQQIDLQNQLNTNAMMSTPGFGFM